jgi:hypothetical protein
MKRSALVLIFVVAACTVDKEGAPCGFTRHCQEPLLCMATDDGNVCAGGCDGEHDPTTGAWRRTCKDPALEPSEGHTVGGKFVGSTGCLCLPKKK